MTNITAGSLVRWTMCTTERETIVLRGVVTTIYGRRFADVAIGDAGVTVTLPVADLTRIEPMPRANVIDMTARRRGKVVRIGDCDLGPAA